ncbi:MAG: tRNA guanosine(34) transglycosylase Tgt, partial [Candidatus Pacebacteria bacterium]|nr:tRNA guanosine(34) transglycosylase Tgt [Candidatus Paceibacterota bacterium]
LFLQPGDEIIKKSGGIHSFMNWNGPTMTDSGGFQVFSLGTGFGKNISKVIKQEEYQDGISVYDEDIDTTHMKLASVDEDGVTFTSHIDGSLHRFTPERSIEIQHNIGADIIVAFDECTSPTAPYEYQKEAMERTHRWAERSLKAHRGNTSTNQGILGVVQGGRFEDLRKESAKVLSQMSFDGFGIGGSFAKEDMSGAVRWVNEILPEEKPRHLLGIGEIRDVFMGVEEGCDLFDCVMPTRLGRHGTIYTLDGPINLLNQKNKEDFETIDGIYSKAYLSHLFRSGEVLGQVLATKHNLKFMTDLMREIRKSIEENRFSEYKELFLKRYYGI